MTQEKHPSQILIENMPPPQKRKYRKRGKGIKLPVVEIVEFTPNPELVVANAARLCYTSADIGELLHAQLDIPLKETDEAKEYTTPFISRLMAMNHLSPFEHINFTFAIEGISRATSHQLVRHRIASYSQQSQRYVKVRKDAYIIPPTIEQDKEAYQTFINTIRYLKRSYQHLLDKGIAPEDARYILPNAWETKLIMTMNARELFHFFRLRCCNRAQWEIRRLAEEMLRKVKAIAPTVFIYAGPPCINGPCPEGKLSCGKRRSSKV